MQAGRGLILPLPEKPGHRKGLGVPLRCKWLIDLTELLPIFQSRCVKNLGLARDANVLGAMELPGESVDIHPSSKKRGEK